MSAKPPFPNTYHLRRVAASAAKACWVCYKPSTSVLITPDNKDFFYVCPGHLVDRGFCAPDAAETARIQAAKDARALEDEKKKVLEEFRDKVGKKDKDKKEKKKKKDGNDKKDGKDDDKDDESDDKKKDDKKDEADEQKKQSDADKSSSLQPGSEEARIFNLSKAFYGQRTERVRSAEAAKRQAERVRNPSLFPSVPTNLPGAPSTGP